MKRIGKGLLNCIADSSMSIAEKRILEVLDGDAKGPNRRTAVKWLALYKTPVSNKLIDKYKNTK